MMKSKTKRTEKSNHPFTILALMLMVLPMLACYCNTTISASQAGVKTDAGKVIEIVGPGGPYSSVSPYEEITVINVSAQQADWTDPSLVTSDEQPIALSLNVTYSRTRDSAALQMMWSNYNSEAKNDDSLRAQVLAKLPGAAKSATSFFTLSQMIGTDPLVDGQAAHIATTLKVEATELNSTGRDMLSSVTEILLQRELKDVGVIVISVTVTNVEPSEEYLKLLERTSNARQEREAVVEERKTTQERVATEQLNTEIELEIAERDRQVREISAMAYSNPALLEIEIARIWAEAINAGDAIIFVPEGTNLSSVLSQVGVGGGGVLPIVPNANGDLVPIPSGQ